VSVIWHGVKSATLRNRVEHTSSDGIFEVKLSYEGQIDLLRASQPKISDGVAGYSVFVEDVTLESTGQADKAILNVSASDRLTKTVSEVVWLRVDEDIRNHKVFAAGGQFALTDDQRREVEAKLNAPSDDTVPTPTGNASELYQRMLKGETNYAVYIPVAKQTSWYLSFPVANGCGQVASILPMAVPSGYTYVSTADSATRSSLYWQRQQEWTGFTSVDTVIVNNT
jgi:hypothetical protein